MILNGKENIIGIQMIDKHLRLGLLSDTGTQWYRIYSNKKGKYIKKHDTKTEKIQNFYIKGELWWAVNRFEKYLEEGVN